jgi:hypothetical protein
MKLKTKTRKKNTKKPKQQQRRPHGLSDVIVFNGVSVIPYV